VIDVANLGAVATFYRAVAGALWNEGDFNFDGHIDLGDLGVLSTYYNAWTQPMYEAFAPAEARRLAARFEWHYTPKHGSWLDVAEIEWSVLARQCLDRRIPDMPTLRREVQEWERVRNAALVKVDWQFTADDARIKLRRLYPTIPLQ
jgi:hypothetical protein